MAIIISVRLRSKSLLRKEVYDDLKKSLKTLKMPSDQIKNNTIVISMVENLLQRNYSPPSLNSKKINFFCLGSTDLSPFFSFSFRGTWGWPEHHRDMCNISFEWKLNFLVPFLSYQKDWRGNSPLPLKSHNQNLGLPFCLKSLKGPISMIFLIIWPSIVPGERAVRWIGIRHIDITRIGMAVLLLGVLVLGRYRDRAYQYWVFFSMIVVQYFQCFLWFPNIWKQICPRPHKKWYQIKLKVHHWK